MDLDHVFKKTNKRFFTARGKKPEVPEGLLCKCKKCGAVIVAEDVRRDYYVCPKCRGYFKVKAYERSEEHTSELQSQR